VVFGSPGFRKEVLVSNEMIYIDNTNIEHRTSNIEHRRTLGSVIQRLVLGSDGDHDVAQIVLLAEENNQSSTDTNQEATEDSTRHRSTTIDIETTNLEAGDQSPSR